MIIEISWVRCDRERFSISFWATTEVFCMLVVKSIVPFSSPFLSDCVVYNYLLGVTEGAGFILVFIAESLFSAHCRRQICILG